jgi:tRNA(fMet)-specific endonuclease VapC
VSISPSDLVALDTNTLVHWVRQDSTGRHILRQYQLQDRVDRPLFSSVVEGEIRGLAKCWNWGANKLKRLDDILSELVRVDAGLREVVLAYADLYAEDQSGGHNTGENDLWIAATAKATGAILLTCDADFRWMDSKTLRVEVIQQVR